MQTMNRLAKDDGEVTMNQSSGRSLKVELNQCCGKTKADVLRAGQKFNQYDLITN